MNKLICMVTFLYATAAHATPLPHRVCQPMFVTTEGVVPYEVEEALTVAIDYWTETLGIAPFILITQDDKSVYRGLADRVQAQIILGIVSLPPNKIGTELVESPDRCVRQAIIPISRHTVDRTDDYLIGLVAHELGIVLGVPDSNKLSFEDLVTIRQQTGGMDPLFWGGAPTFEQVMRVVGHHYSD